MTDGTPKGTCATRTREGVDCKDLNAESMREILSKHNDFVQQKTLLEERVEARGHICLNFVVSSTLLNAIGVTQRKKLRNMLIYGSIVRLANCTTSFGCCE